MVVISIWTKKNNSQNLAISKIHTCFEYFLSSGSIKQKQVIVSVIRHYSILITRQIKYTITPEYNKIFVIML